MKRNNDWTKSERGAAPVTFYKSVKVKNGTKPVRFDTLEGLYRLQTADEKLKTTTAELRALKAKDKEAYKAKRRELMSPFQVGEWTVRGQLKTPVPLLLFDIDGGTEASYQRYLEKAANSPYIYQLCQSLGGGVRICVWASFKEPQRNEAYLQIVQHLSEIFEIPISSTEDDQEHIDISTSDPTRMWYVAHTPPELFYQNSDSEVFNYQAPQLSSEASTANRKDYEGGGKYAIAFTEDEKALDVIRQIVSNRQDITRGRNNVWFPKVLLPLAHFFGEAGRQHAHAVCQFHTDYSPEETDKEFDEALRKDRGSVTIGSFLYLAQSCGISYDVQQIMAMRQNGTATNRKVLPATPNKKQLPIIPPTRLEGNDLPDPDPQETGFFIDDGRYKFQDKKKTWQSVSNFTIRPLYLLRDSKQPKRILELTNVFGETTIICCTVKAMTSNTEFSALVEGRGNFVPSWVSYQFSAIKEYLYQYEETAEEITVLGTQADTGYFAFANGIFDGKAFHQINEYGIAQIGDQRFYLPAFSKVNEDAPEDYHNERKFIFQEGQTTFATWSKQLMAVFDQNAILGICFVVASAFRDIVFSHANSFPMLFLFGPKGTGKTTYRTAMHRLFGNYGPNDAIGLGSASSPKGFSRKLAQIRNGLQPFEEYKNKIDPKLIEMLKNIYDGIGYERAQTSNDNRTHSTLINSSVILGGQEMPTKENALFSRVLMLTFGQVKFSAKEKAAFAQLEKMISGGMGNVLLEILQYREMMIRQFHIEYAKIYGHLRQDPETQSMEERALSNVAAVLAPFKVLAGALAFPFDYKSAYRFVRESIKLQHRQMSKTNEVNQFWHVLDALEGQKFIKDTHYDIRDGILSLNMKLAYMVYADRAGKQNLNMLDETTLKSYLSMQPYFVKQKGGRLDKTVRLGSEAFSKPIRCMQFRIEEMKELEIDFFES